MGGVNLRMNAQMNSRGGAVGPQQYQQPDMTQAILAKMNQGYGELMRGDVHYSLPNTSVRGDMFAQASGHGLRAGGGRVRNAGTGVNQQLFAQAQIRYQGGGGQARRAGRNQGQMRAQMRAMGNMGAKFNVALQMGHINPQQHQRLNGMQANFQAFAGGMVGGGFAASVGADMGTYNNHAGINRQLDRHQNWLQALNGANRQVNGRVDDVAGRMRAGIGNLGERMNRSAAQMRSQQQLMTGVRTQLGNYGRQINSNSNGLGQLSQQIAQLNASHMGLGGVVDGLGDKLNMLDGLFGQFRNEVGGQFADMQVASDTRFQGVDQQLNALLEQINGLRTELTTTKNENIELRGLLGSEATRLDNRIDLLTGKFNDSIANLNNKIETNVTNINVRIDQQVTILQAKDAELAGTLETFKGDFNKFVTDTTNTFAEQSTKIEGAYKKIGDINVSLDAKINDVEAKLTKAMNDGDKTLQDQLTAQKTELQGVKADVAANREAIAENTRKLEFATNRVSDLTNKVNDLMKNTADLPNLRAQIAAMNREIAGHKADIRVLVNVAHQHHQAIDRTAGRHVAVDILINGGGRVNQRDPLMIDLDGSGTIGLEAGNVTTNLLGGEATTVGNWSDGTDGFLVIDSGDVTLSNDERFKLFRENQEITAGADVSEAWLAEHGAGGTAFTSDGWNHLAAFDVDNDGVLRNNDPIFDKLKIWVDANKDGVVQDGEYAKLAEHGITEFRIPGEGTIGTAIKDGAETHAEDVSFQAAQ